MMIVTTVTVLVVKMRCTVGDDMVCKNSKIQVPLLHAQHESALYTELRLRVKQPWAVAARGSCSLCSYTS